MSELLLKHFDLLAKAPDSVARLRELILTLAVQGKLVPQDPSDEPASLLLQRIRREKDRLIAEGKINGTKPLSSESTDRKSRLSYLRGGSGFGWEICFLFVSGAHRQAKILNTGPTLAIHGSASLTWSTSVLCSKRIAHLLNVVLHSSVMSRCL